MNSQFIVVTHGVDAYGPFNTVREAKQWAEATKVTHGDAKYRIIQLMRPY